jgi:hypothetical protein
VERLYDEVVRSAFIRSAGLPSRAHLPSTYRSAYRQVQGNDGLIRSHGVDLPMAAIERFGELVLEGCERIEEFKHARFIHEFRGTKGAFRHDPTDPAQSFYALRNFLSDLGFSDPFAQYSEDPEINRTNLGLDSPHMEGKAASTID